MHDGTKDCTLFSGQEQHTIIKRGNGGRNTEELWCWEENRERALKKLESPGKIGRVCKSGRGSDVFVDTVFV